MEIMNKRRAGILAHITSLPGAYSVGSLGGAARCFVDRISEAGFSLWQVLPMSVPDGHGSPYRSAASFAPNPCLIDLPTLYEEGLIEAEELRAAASEDGDTDFERLMSDRLALLRLAALRVTDRTEIVSYIDERPELSSAAHFLALRSMNGGLPWQRWKCFRADIDELFFFEFIIYKFVEQWQSLRAYANAHGVSIIGDLPMYVDADSADVWSEPEQFLLDADGYPSAVAGVPPDYFSPRGQLWGNPLYDVGRMRDDGYSLFCRRLAYALEMYDGVRIDHFRAIEAFWAVPRYAKDAADGRWVAGAGRELVRAMRGLAKDRLVIAEDLGDITDAVRDLVSFSGFAGMRVLQFGFMGGGDPYHLPHNYPPHAVAYTGTHDNDTLIGFISALTAAERARLAEYVGSPTEDTLSIASASIRALYASCATAVILPVQDVLCADSDSRMNTPGTTDGNWRYRISTAELESFPRARFARLAAVYGRM